MYVHTSRGSIFDFYTLHYNNFFSTARTVKISIVSLYLVLCKAKGYMVEFYTTHSSLRDVLGCGPFDAFKCSERHALNVTLRLVH